MILQKRSNFHVKLFAYFWAVLIFAFIFSAYFYVVTVRQTLINENFRNVEEKLEIIISLLGQYLPFDEEQTFQERLKSLGLIFRVRITYIDKTGRVIGDSEVPFEKIPYMENHSDRPEFHEAWKNGTGRSIRPSTTIRRHLLYVAKRCDVLIGSRYYEGVMRLSESPEPSPIGFGHLLTRFGLILAFGFVFSSILAYWLIGRLYGSIEEVVGFVHEIIKGNIKRRLIASPRHEFPELVETLNSMADAMEEQLNKATKTTEELETILEGMREGVLLLSEEGKIVMANPFLIKTLIKSSSWKGRYPIELIPSVDLHNACGDVVRGRVRNTNLRISFKDGDIVYDVSISRLERQGKFLGALAVFHDVSEAARVEKIRRDFVANVSHALRTPLTSIKGYAETVMDILSGREEFHQARTFIDVVLRNAEYMMKLVDKLLKLAEIESSSGKETFEPVNVVDIAIKAWDVCSYLASEKQVQLERSVEINFPIVKGQREQLFTLFQNLYENALRYQPHGVPLKLTVTAQSDEEIKVCLEDSGPGIDETYRERIFERFFRIERVGEKEKNSAHTGLGLAICKHIVKNHGGKIWVEGEKGARFCFTLPRYKEKG
ncbi:MAG: ATP-binding protein [Thermodesulforhabdaceae bacterium]